ncbi:MAG: glyoxylate/hydroxypyruvate reductase A [Flavobacteriaceae bacterium]|nr:glyoxylate/hydroxypyruvate reductase A [Flavobacteriaceae bacterium]
MSIALFIQHRFSERWKDHLTTLLPDQKIEIYPEIENPDMVEYAISWKHEMGVFSQFKNLKVIASLGAGVHHILKDESISKEIKVTRIVDDQLQKDMASFVLTQCLNVSRNIFQYLRQQENKEWKLSTYKTPEETKVGILGMGVLGKATAQLLHQNGFQVLGWSRSKKEIDHITTYEASELNQFLSQTEILVCLLPITKATIGIVNHEIFNQLPKGSSFINVARGELVEDADLLQALEKKQLNWAILDVFKEEPLPEDHLFWEHPKVVITPHSASLTNPKTASKQLAENYLRLEEKKDLLNVVDRERGY